MAKALTTQTRPARTRRPLYKRPRFWGFVAFLVILAVGAAIYLMTNVASLQETANGATGKIHVTTKPDKATIILDGKEQKKLSDTEVRTTIGRHQVKLQLAGYDDQEVQVDLQEGKDYELEHIFVKNGETVLPSTQPGQSATTTYTNPKFGYSLSYPSSWSVDTDPSGIAHFYNESATKKRKTNAGGEIEEALAVLAQANPQNQSAEQFYKSREEYAMEDQSQIAQRPIQAAGQTAYQYDTPYGFVPYTVTIITGKGQAFLLQIRQNSPDRKIYDQILSSFKLN